jgi:hypothetical protein
MKRIPITLIYSEKNESVTDEPSRNPGESDAKKPEFLLAFSYYLPKPPYASPPFPICRSKDWRIRLMM